MTTKEEYLPSYQIVVQAAENIGPPTKNPNYHPKKNHKEGQPSDIYLCNVFIISPSGEIVDTFKANSGGFGKGYIEGLIKDIDGDSENLTNVTYKIQNPNRNLKMEAGANHGLRIIDVDSPNYNKAFSVRLISPDYVHRGLNASRIDTDQGAFCLHPDGGKYGNVRVLPDPVKGNGTEGCIGFRGKDADDFFYTYNNIPDDLKPSEVSILSREINISKFQEYIKAKNKDFISALKDINVDFLTPKSEISRGSPFYYKNPEILYSWVK